MMNLPHLTFLRSFESAARLLSFTGAAEELNCTQSAVSNHVRSLEEFIGRPLFIRHARSLSLTGVGEAYLPSVRHALQEIDAATNSLFLQNRTPEVTVSCPFSLAGNWLAGLVKDFNTAHPEVILTIHGTLWNDVEANVADISITIHHVEDVDNQAEKLWDETLAVVCAPGFAVAGEKLERPEQIQDSPLIHILGRTAYWQGVGRHFGLEDLNRKAGFYTNGSNLALEMATRGLGCAAVPVSLLGPYLERGLLCEPFACAVPSPWTYFVKSPDRPVKPAVRLFRDWLLKAAAQRRA